MILIYFLQNFDPFIGDGCRIFLHTLIILSDPIFIFNDTSFDRYFEDVLFSEDLQLSRKVIHSEIIGTLLQVDHFLHACGERSGFLLQCKPLFILVGFAGHCGTSFEFEVEPLRHHLFVDDFECECLQISFGQDAEVECVGVDTHTRFTLFIVV